MFFFSFAVVLQVGEEKYLVEGRFPLHDPWWKITCRVRKCKRKHFVRDYLSYSLRTDLQSVGGAIVSLFLKACTASPRSVKPFMDWVSKNIYEEPVTVMNVKNALQSFGSKRKYKAVSKELKSCVQHSGEIITIQSSNSYDSVNVKVKYYNATSMTNTTYLLCLVLCVLKKMLDNM